MDAQNRGRGNDSRSLALSTRLPASFVWAPVFALLLTAGLARAEWPLIWDFDGRSDRPVASRLAPGGDLFILVEAYRVGFSSPSAVLMRVDSSGEIVWTRPDLNMVGPTALALGNGGRALALGRNGTELRVTSIAPGGAIEWSRNRSGVTQEFAEYGPASQPVWDTAASAWRIPAGIDGSFAILSWSGDGTPLPDHPWSPPSGEAIATAVVPRPAGGLLVTGRGEMTVPGWWTVALDAAGAEIWSHFEDGETNASAFSSAFPLVADAERVTIWADDETLCGLFSLRLWSLDAETGAPLWDTTWPPPGGCTFLIPDVVQLSGDRILASGQTTHFGSMVSPETAAIAFDAETGALVWERGAPGATSVIRADLASSNGSALVASTLFPPINPGPTPLWLSAWNRDGEECTEAVEILPARVAASVTGTGGTWYIIGSEWSTVTAEDLVVQSATDPCRGLFRDGFESGTVAGWSGSAPP